MTLSFFEDVDFDDGPPTEAHPRGRGRRGRRGGGDDDRPPGAPRGGMPSGRRRLLVAIAALVVVVIVGWYWIRACQADAQRRAYENYVTDVNQLVKQSDDIGQKLDNAILDPTATKKKLVGEVQGYATSQAAITASTARLHDTGRLRGLQSWLDTTMRYRTQGLQGMAAALDSALSTKLVPVSAVANVSDAYERLLASDVLYSDSFQRPAATALAKANIKGVSISNSTFALTPRYVAPPYLRQLLVRVVTNGTTSPADTSGAAVGTELLKVVAVPSNKQLVPGSITSVPASTDLTFKVSIKNSGDVPVTKVQVRFVEQNLSPQTQTIKIINPGGVATVSFAPKSPTLGIPTKIVVRSVPVLHEKNTGNNTATYRVEYAG
jgi:CARDB